MIGSYYPLLLVGVLGVGAFASQSGGSWDVSRRASQPTSIPVPHKALPSAPHALAKTAAPPSDFDTEHVEWCQKRYRSYNPRDNTWISYRGKVRECISPVLAGA
jgi:hypothetical protein